MGVACIRLKLYVHDYASGGGGDVPMAEGVCVAKLI
jgi:hypothetical protein